MRRITRLAVITAVLAAAMLLSATCVFAESGTFGKGMSWNFSDGTLTLIGTGAMPNYRNYNWDKETWGRPWEKVIEKTRTVVVGEGITRIGDNAFCRDFYKEGAKSVLSKVTLPESLTVIGESAFMDCQIESVEFPEGLTEIGDSAFLRCPIQSLAFPDSLTTLGGSAFNGTPVKEVILPDHLESVGGFCFQFCEQLETVVLPASLKTIGEYAFACCPTLTRVTIPEGIAEIGDSAFTSDDALTEITIPSSVKQIGSEAFDRCPQLKTVQFSEGLEKIGQGAFCDCAIENLALPATLEYIGSSAFCNNPLESATGFEHADFIGNYAFGSWEGVEDLIREENGMVFLGTTLMEYTGTSGEITVPEGTTSICDYAFANVDRNTSYVNLAYAEKNPVPVSVTLPASVKHIGYGAFYQCSNLSDINLENVRIIDEEAFYACTSLQSIRLAEELEMIVPWTFWGCKSLTSADLPGVRIICEHAFQSCGKLANVRLGKPLDRIDEYAFASCGSLREMPALSEQVTILPECVFRYCKSLTKINIPASVTTIEDGAFEVCTKLKTITIPETVKKIDSEAFYYSGLKTIIGVKGSAAYKFAKRQGITFKRPSQKITTGKASYKIGVKEKVNLEAATTGDGRLTFQSSNKKLFTVTKKGVVKAKKKGKGFVTIKAAGTNHYAPATKKVKVVIVKSAN